MKNFRLALSATFLSTVLLPSISDAHVRQRSFYQGDNEGEGQESILHWPLATDVPVSMHEFSGVVGKVTGSLDTTTSINFASARVVMANALKRWTDPLVLAGISSSIPLALDLDTGENPAAPNKTSSNCETAATTSRGQDNINNIVFTSKVNANCASPLTSESGVIGVTRARYSQTSGVIVEADIQFDDVEFKFKTSGSNNLNVYPREINLYDVAVHELGHFFGLDHSSSRTSTMLFAVADELETPKTDDKLGLFSIYAPQELQSDFASLKGSVSAGSTGLFGATVFLLNSRTLDVSASEITNNNGAFQFCALPPGPHIAFANSYVPYGVIDRYYTGAGDGVTRREQDSNGRSVCFNPGCEIMTSDAVHSFVTKEATGTTSDGGGLAMQVFQLNAGQDAQYLNITARTSPISLVDAPDAVADAEHIELDEPRLAKLSQTNIPLAGLGSNVGTDSYRFTVPASKEVNVRLASLRLYTRLEALLTIKDPANSYADITSTYCTNIIAADPKVGIDPSMDCNFSAATVGDELVLEITGTGAACSELPGNAPNCASAGVNYEDSSIAVPYYIVSLYEPDLSEGGVAADAFSQASSAATTYLNLPTCPAYGSESALSLAVSKGDRRSDGGCCGTLRSIQGGPSGPASFWLAILLSPLTWFAMWWIGIGRRRRQLR